MNFRPVELCTFDVTYQSVNVLPGHGTLPRSFDSTTAAVHCSRCPRFVSAPVPGGPIAMRIDIQTLGTFNSLAREGAERAASSLSQLAGDDVDVSIAKVELVPVPDLALEFSGTHVVGVEIGYGGGMDGTIVLAFDQNSADRLLDRMLPGADEYDAQTIESGVTEAANIMAGGFLAAWGEHFESALQPEPPEYISGEWEAIMPMRMPVWNEYQAVLTFASQLTTAEETIGFNVYMFPERDSFESIIADAVGDRALSLDKLSAFNEMTKAGAKRASEKITEMTDIHTNVEVSRLTIVPFDDVESYVGSDHRIGAAAALQEAPGGFVAVLFDTDSAKTVGDALLPIDPDDDGVTDMHRSALEEIGNIMVSGFIDGWANTLGRKIPHEPPSFVEGTGTDTVGPLVDDVSGDNRYAFLLDSTVSTPDGTVHCNLFALPRAEQFQAIIEELSLESATEAIYDPSQLEPGEYDDLK